MFSLIITLVSIALVTALAIATVYYGGDSFKQGAAKAAAATLVNQAEQITAAGHIAVSQGAAWPATAMGPQFPEAYLKTMPVPPARAYASDTPVKTDWTYYLPDAPSPAVKSNQFALKNKIKEDVCLAVNKQMGFAGIPAAWDGVSMVQCFGTGTSYTFFVDPSGSSPQTAAAVAKSVFDANAFLAMAPMSSVASDDAASTATTQVSSAAPGYPRLCASGRIIPAGNCVGGLGNGTPPPETPPVEPPAPSGGATFVSDSFTGANGALIMSHMPEIGSNWIRPYEVKYGYSDCNWHIQNGKLEASNWSCWGADQSALNTATPPSADYEVSATFTVKDTYDYVELYVLGRASVDDWMQGYMYLSPWGDASAQISAKSEGNQGFETLPALRLTVGPHTLRMKMVGNDFKLYYDGVLVHQRVVSVINTPGMAGFSMHHNGDIDYVAVDNFLAK